MKAAEEALTQRLTLAHGKQDFYTRNMQDILDSVESSTRNIKLFLTMIGVISLVVGGIGVMNIMLVSVTERTREIGIRMAIGAAEGDILVQFLVEAVVLSLIGGLFGLLLGLGVIRLLTQALGWAMELPLPAVIAAVGTSGGIGIVFGFFPARRAARLDPIVALQSQ